jgi:hypothetical protein
MKRYWGLRRDKVGLTGRGVAVVIAAIAAITGTGVAAASAATTYACPLTSSAICDDPLSGTVHGDVLTGDGYGFNLSGSGAAGYVQVDNSGTIPMGRFPVSFSVEVKGVGIPSSSVGDYDVVRGTPTGNWKIEVVAKNNRTTARAACFFKGASGKATAAGGPDLNTRQSQWTTITCTNTGSAVELRVDGVLVKRVAVTTGTIPNPGPMLVGAKNTSGGDQFSGYARNVQINVP